MKNASHNQINSAISIQKTASATVSLTTPVNTSNSNSARTTGSIHQTNSSKLITNRASEDQNIIPSNRQQHHNISTKLYSNSIGIPHARALYDFTSKENGYKKLFEYVEQILIYILNILFVC